MLNTWFSMFQSFGPHINYFFTQSDQLSWISRCKHWRCWQLHLWQGAQHGGPALIFNPWEAQLHYNNSHYQYLTHFHICPTFCLITDNLCQLGPFCRKVKPRTTIMPWAPAAPLTVPWPLLFGPLDSPLPQFQISPIRWKYELVNHFWFVLWLI